MKINFNVCDLDIKYTDEKYPVNDSTNFVKAIFNFSGAIWEKSTVKTAVFHQLNKAYSVILTDDWCYVPPEVLKNNGFSVGVMTSYADENTTKTVYTKSPCAVYTSPSCYAESFANSMTQSQYEQIMELLASGDFGGGGGGNVTITYDEATESLQIGGSGVSIEFDETTGNLNISSGTSQAAEPLVLTESGEVARINGYDLKDKTARKMLESVDFEGLAEIGKELDEGKSLSSNDFTDEDKAKLNSIPTKTSDLTNDSGYLITNRYTNVTVLASAFVEDNTFEDYPHKADISIDGVTASDYANIVFSLSDVQSKNYASTCITDEGIISIYAVNVPSADITIPLIEVVKI